MTNISYDKLMNDKRIKILRDMDTGKAINKLALPAIIGFMVMAIYNVADTVFVSWWSYKGAGAVQVLFPIMMLASAIGLTFGIGGGSYISRLLGQNKSKMANSVVTTSLYTGLFIGIIYIAFSLFYLGDIVKIFGASGEIIELSILYGRYIIIGSIFVIASMVLNNSLRAEGSAKYSMIGMGLGSLINIVLDPIFIFTLDLGIEGAAIATMLSQAISCGILYQFYLRKKTLLCIHPRYFKFDVHIYSEVLKIGIPTFFRQFLFSIAMGLLNKGADVVGGEYLLSAMGIAIKVTSMMGFFIFGMGQGLQPVVGYNYGANNIKRVLSAQRHGFIKTTIGTSIGVAILVVFANQIISVFTKEPKVIEYGVVAIRSLSLALIFMAISNTVAIVFQAIGHGRAAMLFSVLRQGILFIPAIIILPKYFGATGLIYAQFVADFLTFVISLIVYIPFLKNERQKLENVTIY